MELVIELSLIATYGILVFVFIKPIEAIIFYAITTNVFCTWLYVRERKKFQKETKRKDLKHFKEEENGDLK